MREAKSVKLGDAKGRPLVPHSIPERERENSPGSEYDTSARAGELLMCNSHPGVAVACAALKMLAFLVAESLAPAKVRLKRARCGRLAVP